MLNSFNVQGLKIYDNTFKKGTFGVNIPGTTPFLNFIKEALTELQVPWTDNCCHTGTLIDFCEKVNNCIGINGDGDPTLFLNQQGDFTSVAGEGLWTESAGKLYPTTLSNNVGIGTATPGAKLEVVGGTFVKGPLFVYNDTYTSGFISASIDSGILDLGSFGESTDTHIRINDILSAIYLKTGNLQIIGISEGDGKVLTSDTSGNATWQSLSAASVNAWGLTGNIGTDVSTNYLGTSDTNALSIRTNGIEAINVAIDQSLHFYVNGGVQLADFALNNTLFTSGTDGNSSISLTPNDFTLSLPVGGGGPVTIITALDTGFVGIGNPSPTATLDVIGTIKYTDGNQAANKILTSDSSGNATWQTATTVVSQPNTQVVYGTGSGITSDNTFIFTKIGGIVPSLTILNTGASNSGLVKSHSFYTVAPNGKTTNIQMADSSASDLSFTLPNTTGSSGNTLTTDGSGNLSWVALGTNTLPYTAKTSTYSITTSDYMINCTSGTFTVTLPTAVGVTGRVYTIKNSGTGIITIATTSAQTIDGASTQTVATLASYQLMSNGANWILF